MVLSTMFRCNNLHRHSNSSDFLFGEVRRVGGRYTCGTSVAVKQQRGGGMDIQSTSRGVNSSDPRRNPDQPP